MSARGRPWCSCRNAASPRSPDEAKRNPGTHSPLLHAEELIPDYASLHPGYGRHLNFGLRLALNAAMPSR
jgi:hypothetical protein